MAHEQSLAIVHDNGNFEGHGLRNEFVCRDLGIAAATGGDFSAHVIRAGEGDGPIEAHKHPEIKFQLVYVTRGEETLKAGSCHLLLPGIEHSVIGWPDNLEMVEITPPAEFSSVPTDGG